MRALSPLRAIWSVAVLTVAGCSGGADPAAPRPLAVYPPAGACKAVPAMRLVLEGPPRLEPGKDLLLGLRIEGRRGERVHVRWFGSEGVTLERGALEAVLLDGRGRASVPFGCRLAPGRTCSIAVRVEGADGRVAEVVCVTGEGGGEPPRLMRDAEGRPVRIAR